MKKLLVFLALVTTCLLARADASGTCGANLTWVYTTADNTLTITGTGDMSNYNYTYTNAPWKSYNSSIKNVIIDDGVTSIGGSAFSGCSGLTSVTIPDAVTSIGDNAFKDCTNLTKVIINSKAIASKGYTGSANLKTIFGDQVTEYVLGENVTSIGARAFFDCDKLTSVTIGNGVTSIGNFAFYGCRGLTSVTIGNGVTSIGSSAFLDCSSLANLTIPDGVTSIGSSAFSRCSSLANLAIPDAVTSIGDKAFQYCSGLTSVTISDAVTSIGSGVFQGCLSLTNVTIPDAVTSIGSGAFQDCLSLTSLTIGKGVTSIISDAFDGCTGLKKVTINSNAIASNTYTSSANLRMTFGDQVTEYVLGENVTSIGSYVFSGCSGLTSVTIPDAVTSIESSAFAGCSGLTSVTIPDAVTSIGSFAFFNCDGLTSITIPNSVTSIGDYAFYGCDGLTSVTIPDGVTSIGNGAFGYCMKLEDINIPKTLSAIGDSTFMSCVSLKNVDIPDNITAIGYRSFSGCTSLKNVNIPSSVLGLGAYSFSGCTSLETVIVGKGKKKICHHAFDGCDNLYSIEFKDKYPPISPSYVKGSVHYYEDIYRYHSEYVVECTEDVGVFGKCSSTFPTITTIICPCGSEKLYKPRFIDSYVIDENCSENYFTIDSEDKTEGNVKIEGEQEIGSTVIVTPNPSPGYEFVRWSDGNTDNPRTITIEDGLDIRAVYEPIVYNITVSANNNTYGTAYGNGNYEYGTTAFITATANTGYKFVAWNDGNTALWRSINVKQDSAFIAEFAIDDNSVSENDGSYTIQSLNVSKGTVSIDGESGIGKTVTITAVPAEGYKFSRWNDGNTENPRVVTIEENMNLRAIFESEIFTIVVSSNNDAYGNVSGSGDYEYGELAILIASPISGYKFSKWNDGNTESIRTLKVKSDYSFVAEFAKDESAVTPSTPTGSYTIGAADPDGGSVSVDGEAGIGKTVTLTATPKDGYRFKQWSDGNTENPRTVTITEGMNLKAEFEILVFTINVVPNNVSYGSASGSGEYEYGSTAFIMASANNGYKFVKWNDGNTAVIRTIKVKKDSAFVAEFAEDESAVTPPTSTGSYTIGAADTNEGSVSVDGDAGIGKTVTLTATPKDGYRFKQWSDGNTENPRIVTITNGMNLKAEFEAYERTWKLNALEWNEDSTKVTVYFYCPEDGKTKSVEAKPVVVEQAATCHEKGSKKRVVTVAFEGQIYEESEETVVDAPRQNIVKKMWGDVLTVVDPNKEFIQYEWYRNGEFVSNKAYVSEAGGLTGEYTLQVTKRDGSKVCSNTVTMSEKRSSAALRVYPNPVTDNVTIEGDFEEGSEIRIVDMNGVLVKKTKAATDGRATVMTSGMTAGAYTVIAGNDTARLIKK